MARLSNEQEQVKATVLSVYKAIEDLDAEELDSHFSPSEDLLAYGQSWASRSKSLYQISEEHRREFKNLESIKISSKELEVHVRDSVAWTADRVHQIAETKDGKKSESDLRLTFVLEKQEPGNTWLIIQWHVSRGM
jgi:ketosteroid isomerase-like protein